MNDAAVQCNLIKALRSWKEASFKAFKCGSEISYSLSLLSSQACPCHLCQLGEQRFLDSSLLPFKRIKNDWRWNIEALGLGSSANAAHLPPASSWKANTEGTFGWRNCECSNRLFLEHGRKVEWGFGGRCRLDLNAIIRFDTSLTLLRRESGVSECKITAERRVHHCRRSVTVNFVHYSRRCIEQL